MLSKLILSSYSPQYPACRSLYSNSNEKMQRTIVNPVFGDTCTFLKTSKETNGRYSHLEVTLAPGGKNPLHRHRSYSETFTSIVGNLSVTVDDKEITLHPGETFTVPKGTAHRFLNRTNKEIKFHIVFTPGNAGAENMLRIVYGLACDGEADKAGVPRSISAIALIGEIGDTRLAGFLSFMSPILKVLASRARKKGMEEKFLAKYCS
jgi:quercetin dioxygenase-like cupin family protein